MTAFLPIPGSTQTINATAASAQAANPINPTPGVQCQVRVVAPSSNANPVFIRFCDASGSNSTASALTDLPILPGTVESFTTTAACLAAVCATGQTGTLYVTTGFGE